MHVTVLQQSCLFFVFCFFTNTSTVLSSCFHSAQDGDTYISGEILVTNESGAVLKTENTALLQRRLCINQLFFFFSCSGIVKNLVRVPLTPFTATKTRQFDMSTFTAWRLEKEVQRCVRAHPQRVFCPFGFSSYVPHFLLQQMYR